MHQLLAKALFSEVRRFIGGCVIIIIVKGLLYFVCLMSGLTQSRFLGIVH